MTAKTRFTDRLKRSIQALMQTDGLPLEWRHHTCAYEVRSTHHLYQQYVHIQEKMHAHFAKLQREIAYVCSLNGESHLSVRASNLALWVSRRRAPLFNYKVHLSHLQLAENGESTFKLITVPRCCIRTAVIWRDSTAVCYRAFLLMLTKRSLKGEISWWNILHYLHFFCNSWFFTRVQKLI